MPYGISESDHVRIQRLLNTVGCNIGGFTIDTIEILTERLIGSVLESHEAEHLRNQIKHSNQPLFTWTQKFLDLYIRKATGLQPLIDALKFDGWDDLVSTCLLSDTPDNVDGNNLTIRQYPSPQMMANLKTLFKVPTKPEFHVRRRVLAMKLRTALHELMKNPSGIIVVHGLAGCGKTTLVADLLNDPSVLRNIAHSIFWNKAATEKEVLSEFMSAHTTALFEKTGNMHEASNFRSAQQAVDSLLNVIKSHYPYTVVVVDGLKSLEVRRLFERQSGRFIVTTRDRSLFTQAHTAHLQCIEVNPSGLTEQETVDLLCLACNCHEHQLPPQARTLHQLAEGHPLVISLIASLIRAHQTNHSLDRWIHYCDKLRDSDTSTIASDNYHDGYPAHVPRSFHAAMKLSFDDLDAEKKEKFTKLVVFFRGCKITPLLCSLLWFGWKSNPADVRNAKIEAEDILAWFHKRSLLECAADESYFMHNMVANFIRHVCYQEKTEKEIEELHKWFVTNLEQVANSSSANSEGISDCKKHLYFYLAYHHVKGGIADRLCDYYCDLVKLKDMISIVSPSCIFADLITYADALNEADNPKLADYHNFLRKNSDLLHVDGVNLVQLALAEQEESHVYKQAIEMATRAFGEDAALFWKPLSGNENRFLAFYDGCHCDRNVNVSHAQFVECVPSLLFMMAKEGSEILICHAKSGKTLDTLQFSDEIREVKQVERDGELGEMHNDKLFVVHTDSAHVAMYTYDAYALNTGVDCLGLDESRTGSVMSVKRHLSSYIPSSNSDLTRYVDASVFPSLPYTKKYTVTGSTVLTCAVSQDEKFLVAATSDRKVAVWNVHDKDELALHTYKHEGDGPLTECAWISIERVGFDTIDANARKIRIRNGSGDATQQTYSILAGWNDGTVFAMTYSDRDSEPYWQSLEKEVLGFDACTYAAVACVPNAIFIWQFSGALNTESLGGYKQVDLIYGCTPSCVALSPDGYVAVVGFNDSFAVPVYNTQNATLLYQLYSTGGVVNSLAFSRDSSRLLVASGTTIVMNWDLNQVRDKWKPTNFVSHVCMIDNKDHAMRKVVTVDDNRKLKVRSLNLQDDCVSTVLNNTVCALAACDQYIACCFESGQLTIFDSALHETRVSDPGTFDFNPTVIALQFSANDLVIVDQQKVMIWYEPFGPDDLRTLKDNNCSRLVCAEVHADKVILGTSNGTSLMTFGGPGRQVLESQISDKPPIMFAYRQCSTGSCGVAIINEDYTVDLYSLDGQARRIASTVCHTDATLVSLSPNGCIAVGGPNRQLYVYSENGGQFQPIIEKNECHICAISKLAFTNDGLLFTLGGSLKAWFSDGRLIQRYPIPGYCKQWAVSCDAKHIIVLDTFGIVHSLERCDRYTFM